MFDRETVVMIAVAITLVATCYLFNELQKQKLDMNNVKTYMTRKVSHAPANDTKPVPTNEIAEEEEE
jgi:hypothetical protein